MRTTLLLLALIALLIGCDYAKEESVQKLGRDVDSVRTEQQLIRKDVERTTQGQAMLQTSLSAMGSGFNVLTESVSDQSGRVERLETRSGRLERDVRAVAEKAAAPQPRRQPKGGLGLYVGTRIDTRTLDETPVRMQWCEGGEGVRGYLVDAGKEPNYLGMQCWRFGDVALFRTESDKGPAVRCLRDIVFDENGTLKALDCDQPAVLYTLSGG